MLTYRALDLGADAVLVGLLGAAFAIAPLFFAIQVGRWTDRGRDGTAMVLGAALSIGSSIALMFLNNVYLLMAVVPVLGIGHLLTMAGGQTVIANRAKDSSYERAFGLLTFYASIGHAFGPLVGGWLADRGENQIDTNTAILFAIGLFVLALLVIFPLGRVDESKRAISTNAKSSARAVMATPGFKSAIFVSGAITSVVDVVLIFLPLLGRSIGLSASQIGILLAVRAAASMGVRVALGPMTNTLGMRNTLNLGSAGTLAAMVAVIFVTDFNWLIAVMLVAGFAMGIGQPATMAWVSRISSPDTKGLAIAIRLTANRLGQVAVPAFAGVVAGASIGGVFGMLAAIQGAAIVVTSRALPNSEQ